MESKLKSLKVFSLIVKISSILDKTYLDLNFEIKTVEICKRDILPGEGGHSIVKHTGLEGLSQKSQIFIKNSNIIECQNHILNIF